MFILLPTMATFAWLDECPKVTMVRRFTGQLFDNTQREKVTSNLPPTPAHLCHLKRFLH